MAEWYNAPWTILSGASASSEIDLGRGGAVYFGIHITSTVNAGTDLTPAVCTTAGGTKVALTDSQGLAVIFATTALGATAITLSSGDATVLSPWRFMTLNTTANTTAELTGYLNIRG